MSHHYSGPDFGFPLGDPRLDFTDLYAFPKPGDAGKSILIMDVHPSAAENPPGPTTFEPFAPRAMYELKIDTDGDAVADIAYQVRFSPSGDGAQTATLRRVDGAQAAGPTREGTSLSRGHPFRLGGRCGSQRQVSIASSRAGAAIHSSAMWKARRTTCGSRATISSMTKMCAASSSKCRTLLWG